MLVWLECSWVPSDSIEVGLPFVGIWGICAQLVAASALSTGGRVAKLGKDGLKVRSL